MKKITTGSFLEYNYVSEPKFSPDGRFISYLVQKADFEANGYKGYIHLVDPDGSTRRLTGLGDAKSACWTPENTILFPAQRCEKVKKALAEGEAITAFYEISPEGGEARLAFTLPVANGTDLTHLEGDLYYLFAEHDRNRPQTKEERAALKEREETYHTFTEQPFWKRNQANAEGKRNRLYLYNRATGELKAVSGEDEMVGRAFHQGSRLIYSWTSMPKGVRDQNPTITAYDCATGEYDEILKPGQLIGFMGEVYGLFWGDKIMIVGTKGEKYKNMQSPDLWLMDPKTRELTKFAAYEYSFNTVCGTDSHLGKTGGVTAQGDKVYFITTMGYRTYVRSVDRQGNFSAPLTPDGVANAFTLHGDRLVYCGFYGDKLCEIYEDGKQLTHENDRFFAEHSAVTPKHLSFTDKDGFTIDGWVMEPVGYQPGKKYPAVLGIHGGPRSLFGDIYFNEHQVWVNDGYFALFCNPRGSDGKGDEFANVWGHYGTYDYENIMQFVDEALAAYPDIDKGNVGVTGGSYGGFMTNWIIGHTDRFKAAASQRSISNWATMEYATAIGYYFNRMNHGTAVLDNAEYLWDISPLKYAPNCKTPTLFIHSDEDYVCWMAEAVQMYSALKLHGCETKLALFKREGHELSRSGSPKPRRARMDEILGWMNKHCK